MTTRLACRSAVLALGLAVGLSVAAVAAPAHATSPPRAGPRDDALPAIAVPPLEWRDRTLANGLRVLSLRHAASPTVSVQVWYRVGSKDDPAGRSGFAHLFEHLMFKSTRYLKAEQFDRLTEDVGGMNNASTRDDVTEYHEVVPSNHLERLLWAEAERMSSLDVSQANFDSERAVVKEEFRARVLAAPYGRLFYLMPQWAYQVHPYKRPGIGNLAELDAASLDDVRRFHATYYRPDNAVLVVTGDFEPAQLDAWVDRYFAPVPRPAAPIPRVTVKEPPWTADRRVDVAGPAVPLPAVAVLWLGPPAGHADVPALKVAEALLASGESARLNQALVYRAQIASQAGFSTEIGADAGLLAAYAVAAGGKPIEANLQALLAQVDALARGPILPAELDKVRTQLVTRALVTRQTPEGLGLALGEAATVQGDPARVNRELVELQAVRAEDVQRVVRTWLVEGRRSVVTYRAARKGDADPAEALTDAASKSNAAAATPASPPPGAKP